MYLFIYYYRNDCKDAYIDIPDFRNYDSIENDIEHLENVWGLYNEFHLGNIMSII